MSEPIQWTNERRKLSELIPWDHNPAGIDKAEAKRLEDSLTEFGQVETIAISPTNEIYDGHQRQKVWSAARKYGPNFEVDVRVSSRQLTDQERRKLVIFLRRGAVGHFDWDELANWNVPDLMSWGLDKDALKEWKFDISALDTMLKSEGGETDDEYSRKIEAPIYTPKGEKPAVKDLFDTTRTEQLLKDIEAADLPEDEKEFLRIAARRHTVLNYKRIADYYAHSAAPVQRLMEDSALVIIDFNRAIELGYVKLSEEIAKQYLEDCPNA